MSRFISSVLKKLYISSKTIEKSSCFFILHITKKSSFHLLEMEQPFQSRNSWYRTFVVSSHHVGVKKLLIVSFLMNIVNGTTISQVSPWTLLCSGFKTTHADYKRRLVISDTATIYNRSMVVTTFHFLELLATIYEAQYENEILLSYNSSKALYPYPLEVALLFDLYCS